MQRLCHQQTSNNSNKSKEGRTPYIQGKTIEGTDFQSLPVVGSKQSQAEPCTPQGRTVSCTVNEGRTCQRKSPASTRDFTGAEPARITQWSLHQLAIIFSGETRTRLTKEHVTPGNKEEEKQREHSTGPRTVGSITSMK
ncbi:uncharacterized protein LOC135202950 [Macrobrachium nipponense]|uniref:uncharacterized protein LOC135202950 n=1 Tax=Macrobrachium nipponense TaxID=159736 RepID=UPI0030C8A39C